ncbi:iron-sulfur cluster carrier protein ApbC [Consotaella salsifontis]|uniref:Iron-sulfur cluster carrier protein n=1 Tax=Consotaella salsifontis TaxID=1365950 RepID=A0A1T4NUF1_9HYPH|nr:iron-sulfur cluster carrier protein ApbC [Consotaella salsifontis]SJZ82889.1 ATP-binding protein involved in chromosome partitioning [Consotaella salsifontis]
MSDTVRQSILDILRQMNPPDGKGDVVSRGMVSEIFVADGKAFFSLTVPAGQAAAFEPFCRAVEERVRTVEGVRSAVVALTGEREAGQAGATPPSRPAAVPQVGRPARAKPEVPGVKSIIAVASGKGGVGKSTTSVNLALGFAALGLKVGILDADVYGPSIPRLLGLSGAPASEGQVLLPKEAFGLKAMSIGLLVEEDTPMIWRGPMVMSALTQLLREVAWGDLDLLVVDMPPGTGDAQLTMAQQVPLAGAVIVSTPQDLALLDARKGIAMFQKVDVPVLGVVENMSYFLCPSCGTRSDIFGHGGARAEAERLGAPFLGEVPLHMAIREKSDAGQPVVATEPDGPHAAIYREIAAKTLAELDRVEVGRDSGPRIVFE